MESSLENNFMYNESLLTNSSDRSPFSPPGTSTCKKARQESVHSINKAQLIFCGKLTFEDVSHQNSNNIPNFECRNCTYENSSFNITRSEKWNNHKSNKNESNKIRYENLNKSSNLLNYIISFFILVSIFFIVTKLFGEFLDILNNNQNSSFLDLIFKTDNKCMLASLFEKIKVIYHHK